MPSEHIQHGHYLEQSLLGAAPRLSSRTERLKHDIREARYQLRRNLAGFMNEIRLRQGSDSDPSVPKKLFLRNLAFDVDDKIQKIIDNERYEVRVYSVVDTVLDKAGGFDFWVELYDNEERKSLADYKIDLTSNREKTIPGQLADAVYFYDAELSDREGGDAIYAQDDYKFLVESATRNMLAQVGISENMYH